MIPWTAGGFGDGQLAPKDQTEAPECQDGGFDAGAREEYENRRNRVTPKNRKPSKNSKRRKKNKRKTCGPSKVPTRGAQPEALSDGRRLLRRRARRPDHQPDRCRAAGHRHRPAAELVEGLCQATRPPTSAATSSHAVARGFGRPPTKKPVPAPSPTRKSPAELLPELRLQPRRASVSTSRASLPARASRCTRIHRRQPGQRGRNRRLRRRRVDHHARTPASRYSKPATPEPNYAN